MFRCLLCYRGLGRLYRYINSSSKVEDMDLFQVNSKLGVYEFNSIRLVNVISARFKGHQLWISCMSTKSVMYHRFKNLYVSKMY